MAAPFHLKQKNHCLGPLFSRNFGTLSKYHFPLSFFRGLKMDSHSAGFLLYFASCGSRWEMRRRKKSLIGLVSQLMATLKVTFPFVRIHQFSFLPKIEKWSSTIVGVRIQRKGCNKIMANVLNQYFLGKGLQGCVIGRAQGCVGLTPFLFRCHHLEFGIMIGRDLSRQKCHLQSILFQLIQGVTPKSGLNFVTHCRTLNLVIFMGDAGVKIFKHSPDFFNN